MCDKNENLFLFFFEKEKSIVFAALVVVTGSTAGGYIYAFLASITLFTIPFLLGSKFIVKDKRIHVDKVLFFSRERAPSNSLFK